jgi:hypothetical protein
VPPVPVPPTPVPGNTSGALVLNGVHDKEWDGVTFDGAGQGGSDSSGVIMVGSGCYNLVFKNCVIMPNRDGVGDGVKVLGGDVHDITFDTCHFMTQPRMGFEANGRSGSGYQRVNLINCTFEVQGSEAVSYDDDTGGAGDCVISGNLIKGGGSTTQFSWGQGFELNNVGSGGQMTVTNNTIWACRGDCFNFNGTPGNSNWVVTGNVIDTTKGSISMPSDSNPVYANNVTGGVFHDNIIINSKSWTVAYLSGCHNMDWTGTQWEGPNNTPNEVGCSGNIF